MRFGIPALVSAAIALVLALPVAAPAAPLGSVENFTGGTDPWTTAPGPDGNVWFTDRVGKKIGRITPAGTITEFSGLSTNPIGIAAGPDGKMWFAEADVVEGVAPPKIGSIDPFAANPESTITEFGTGLQATSAPFFITAGPDGNMWFTDVAEFFGGLNKIGRITPAGTITEFGVADGLNPGAVPQPIAPGPDGNVWFSDIGSPKAIGKITPAGAITEYELDPAAFPSSIAPGADGNLWFPNSEKVGRITTTGEITEFALPAEANPRAIAPGPDGNMWFTDLSAANERQNVVIEDSPAATGTGDTTEGSAVVEEVVTESGAFAVGQAIAGENIPPGTTIAVVGAEELELSNPVGGTGSSVALKSSALGGTYKLCKDAAETECTTPLPYNAEASAVESALAEPAMFGPGVSVGSGFSNTILKFEWQIDFEGALKWTNFPLLVCGTGALSGTSPTCATTTVLEGAPHKLDRITPSGAVSRFGLNLTSRPGTVANSLTLGSDGNLWLPNALFPKGLIRFGVGAPGASLRAPSVLGSAQEEAAQTCGNDRWANWAGMQPFSGGLLPSSPTPPAVEWLLEGTVVSTSPTYTPASGSAGDELACRMNATYRLPLGVSVAAQSDGVEVLPEGSGGGGATGPTGPAGTPGTPGATGPAGTPGATGPAGANGTNGSNGAKGSDGAAGPQGPAGAQGPAGPQGPAGKVTCKVKQGKKTKVTCTVKNASASAKRPNLRWRVTQGGRTYDRGVTHSNRVAIEDLDAGRYVLHVQGQKGTVIVVG